MFRSLFASLFLAYSLTVAGPVVDLLKQGRYGEAKRLLESKESHPRYQLLYFAMVESDVARACSLYQVIAIRYPHTDCDTVARERLQLARDMGFVIIPIAEWEQAPAGIQALPFTAYARDSVAVSGGRPAESPAMPATQESEDSAFVPDSTSDESPEDAEPDAWAQASEPPVETPHLREPAPLISRVSPGIESTSVKAVPPDREPLEATAVGAGKWFVQVGAFRNVENADRLAARLRAEGYNVVLVPRESTDGVLMQVRVGGYVSRIECEQVSQVLKEQFELPTQIVTK